MGFEKIIQPGNPEENDGEIIRFEEGGRNFSVTPEEREAHEKAEAKRKLIEGEKAEAVESEEEDLNLTPEEEKIIEKIVPDAKTRRLLGREAIRAMLNNYEEPEEERKEAA